MGLDAVNYVRFRILWEECYTAAAIRGCGWLLKTYACIVNCIGDVVSAG